MVAPRDGKKRAHRSSRRGICVPYRILVLCGGCFFFFFLFTVRNIYFGTGHIAGVYSSGVSVLDDETNIPIPKRKDGSTMSIEERIRYLELKTQSYMNFGSKDPFFGSTLQTGICKGKVEMLEEYACKMGWEGVDESYLELGCPGYFDQPLCLDDLPPPREWDILTDTPKYSNTRKKKNKPCLVYDFGIRAQPQFGAVMARIFGCEVHAFDPSAVSTDFMFKSKEGEKLRALPNYHFYPYGVGGIDGTITLYEYNWGQVTNIKYPACIRDCKDSDGVNCKVVCKDDQKKFELPVKTLPTIMKELGHEGRTIDVLKLDVEGSEFAFLEQLLDHQGGCPDYINQLTMEWHHYPVDPRYGEGASPPVNSIATLLHACGLQMFFRRHQGGWPAKEKIYEDLKMNDVRYNIMGYKRVL